ncbi:MAG: nitroreductase family deazaflavin-dependent oxidoreductase [Chloroflexota bacterium]|nr:nitroreductase family deazaflavin-dependent oxidoreductase [Chloroflexota bacterium]
MATEETTRQTGRSMSPRAKAIFRLVTRAHAALYRRTGGKVAGSMRGRNRVKSPVLLLNTVGRRTGKPRTSPLLYLEDGQDLVIVASAGGAAKHPDWWLNLEANPETTVEVGSEVIPVRAELATGAGRERLWQKLVEMYPGYADYQKRTSRKIPVVILRRKHQGD